MDPTVQILPFKNQLYFICYFERKRLRKEVLIFEITNQEKCISQDRVGYAVITDIPPNLNSSKQQRLILPQAICPFPLWVSSFTLAPSHLVLTLRHRVIKLPPPGTWNLTTSVGEGNRGDKGLGSAILPRGGRRSTFGELHRIPWAFRWGLLLI